MAQRQEFVETVAQHYDTRRFHFLDETGLRLDACRRYGRAVGGQRVGQPVPLRRGPALTLIGTLSPQGLGAVQLFEGALNYERFALYVSRFLAPTLRRGDVLVLDNLAVHKIGGLREWLAERGVEVLFLPPYSPDFSPIEQAWSKLKTALRTARARSRQALEEAVRAAVDWITSADAKNWFDHCGYHVQTTSKRIYGLRNRYMRYFFLLALILQRFSTLAQIDTLQSKASVEAYLKRRYHYKDITLNAVNLVIQDTNIVQPVHPSYWLKADFNHDGKVDLFASATVEKGKRDNQSELFILASEGNHYNKIDIIDPVSYVYSGEASYSTYSASGKSYLVINILVQKTLRPQDIRRGYYSTYSTSHDTSFVQNNKQMIYANHPAHLVIECVKFSTTECFGTCPVFQLVINNDGSVNYKGIRYVDKIGDYALVMSKLELSYLISLLAAINPPRLNDHYSADETDSPTVYLIVRYTNGQTKSIKDYGERGTYGLAVLYKFLLDLRNF